MIKATAVFEWHEASSPCTGYVPICHVEVIYLGKDKRFAQLHPYQMIKFKINAQYPTLISPVEFEPVTGFKIVDWWRGKPLVILVTENDADNGVCEVMTPALRKYYKGPHWKVKSEETQRLAGYQCQVVEDVMRCKRPSQQAHHTNYACLYHEVPGEDTIAVCGWHHMLLHGIVARPANDNQPVLWDWFDAKTKKAA